MNPTIKLVQGVSGLKNLEKAIAALVTKDVLVGVPEATRSRQRADQPNNAMLAYIHDNGSPQANIPQREFLRPGIKNAQPQLVERLGQTARKVLDGNLQDVEKGLVGAGLIAQKSVRRKITTGPFAPLKPATIRARSRKHKGRKSTKVTPLIDTGQLRQAINFVVVDKK